MDRSETTPASHSIAVWEAWTWLFTRHWCEPSRRGWRVCEATVRLVMKADVDCSPAESPVLRAAETWNWRRDCWQSPATWWSWRWTENAVTDYVACHWCTDCVEYWPSAAATPGECQPHHTARASFHLNVSHWHHFEPKTGGGIFSPSPSPFPFPSLPFPFSLSFPFSCSPNPAS